MGSWKVTLCAGFAVAAAALTPAAYAADGGGVSVAPSSPAPGAEVALRVSGCEGTTATAVSRVFVADARLAGADGAMAGEARIRTSAEPGSYDVRITCADFQAQGTVTVSGDGATAPSAASPAAPAVAGTAHFASVDTYTYADGPGTADTVTGLVLAGVAATAVTLRSACRSRRTG
ncbi:hypothetical protein ACWCQK_09400 [Streptomyces sp. NPDC002306]